MNINVTKLSKILPILNSRVDYYQNLIDNSDPTKVGQKYIKSLNNKINQLDKSIKAVEFAFKNYKNVVVDTAKYFNKTDIHIRAQLPNDISKIKKLKIQLAYSTTYSSSQYFKCISLNCFQKVNNIYINFDDFPITEFDLYNQLTSFSKKFIDLKLNAWQKKKIIELFYYIDLSSINNMNDCPDYLKDYLLFNV